jgi:hypothetical protein
VLEEKKLGSSCRCFSRWLFLAKRFVSLFPSSWVNLPCILFFLSSSASFAFPAAERLSFFFSFGTLAVHD